MNRNILFLFACVLLVSCKRNQSQAESPAGVPSAQPAGVSHSSPSVPATLGSDVQPRLATLLDGLQQHNFAKIYNNSFTYLKQMTDIGESQPNVLAGKLVDEFIQREKENYERRNPPLEIRHAMQFFDRASSQYEIIEKRDSGRMRLTSGFQEYPAEKCFVKVKYASLQDSPAWSNGRVLKEAIIEVTVVTDVKKEMELFVDATVVEAGNVYWDAASGPVVARLYFNPWEGPFPANHEVGVAGGTPPYTLYIMEIANSGDFAVQIAKPLTEASGYFNLGSAYLDKFHNGKIVVSVRDSQSKTASYGTVGSESTYWSREGYVAVQGINYPMGSLLFIGDGTRQKQVDDSIAAYEKTHPKP